MCHGANTLQRPILAGCERVLGCVLCLRLPVAVLGDRCARELLSACSLRSAFADRVLGCVRRPCRLIACSGVSGVFACSGPCFAIAAFARSLHVMVLVVFGVSRVFGTCYVIAHSR